MGMKAAFLISGQGKEEEAERTSALDRREHGAVECFYKHNRQK
jgi:hypothetical protein